MGSLVPLHKALLDGLSTFLSAEGLARSNVIPMGQTADIRSVPYVVYGFSGLNRHPGPTMGFNPNLVAGYEWLPEDGSPLLMGQTTNVVPGSLVDTGTDFSSDAGMDIQKFFYVKNTDTEKTTYTLGRVGKHRLWVNTDLFTAIGEGYEIRRHKVRKWYNRPQRQALMLTFVHEYEDGVDALADKGQQYFQLPTQAEADFKDAGWLVEDVGSIIPTDFVEQRQGRSYSRDLTVVLRGKEFISEDVSVIESVDLDVQGEHGGLPDPTAIIDRPAIPVEIANE